MCLCVAVVLLWNGLHNLQSTTLLGLCLKKSPRFRSSWMRFFNCSLLSVVIHALTGAAMVTCDAPKHVTQMSVLWLSITLMNRPPPFYLYQSETDSQCRFYRLIVHQRLSKIISTILVLCNFSHFILECKYSVTPVRISTTSHHSSAVLLWLELEVLHAKYIAIKASVHTEIKHLIFFPCYASVQNNSREAIILSLHSKPLFEV